MAISDYQQERINDVRSWYAQVYRSLDDHVPIGVRYMTLWAVFNALYNIADYPNVRLKSVSLEDEAIIPFIRGRDDDKKLRFIARKLARDRPFIERMMRNFDKFIAALAQRTPEVVQPSGVTSIEFQHDGNPYTLNLLELRGIASTDYRMFLENGSVLFSYRRLELNLNRDGIPRDCQKFMRQLIFMLYQLRNNIVHGGSAAFFLHKTELALGAIGLLDSIVKHLLDHPELLEQEAH